MNSIAFAVIVLVVLGLAGGIILYEITRQRLGLKAR